MVQNFLIVFIATCGGSYYGGTGVINSHDYPSTYGNNEDCEWTLRGLRGHYLTLTFDALDVEGSGNCSDGDYIEIRDLNATGTSKGLFIHGHRTPHRHVSMVNKVHVIYLNAS